jgi:hypothetical protein
MESNKEKVLQEESKVDRRKIKIAGSNSVTSSPAGPLPGPT